MRDAAWPCNIARKSANKTIGGRDWAGEGGWCHDFSLHTS